MYILEVCDKLYALCKSNELARVSEAAERCQTIGADG